MTVEKLSWEEAARAMAASPEEWCDWDVTAADGLNDLPWQVEKAGRVAEPLRRVITEMYGE